MTFAIITPTRGDRADLLNFTRSRIPPQFEHIIIDYKPSSDQMDLVPRIKQGIEQAKAKGLEYVMIAEDDDYTPLDYYQTLDFEGYDFFGFTNTNYYNLKNRTYQTFEHQDRSSLFCTGFKISALDRFDWPDDHWTFLDIRFWDYANRNGKEMKLLSDNPCLGIKHGIGKCAGKGHKLYLKHSDPQLNYLKEFVDEDAFEFYSLLMDQL